MAKYEYGLFNVDKEKICAVSGANPDNPDWDFLWDEPFTLYFDKNEAEQEAGKINNDRFEKGMLNTHGPVKAKRRTVTYGDWKDYE